MTFLREVYAHWRAEIVNHAILVSLGVIEVDTADAEGAA